MRIARVVTTANETLWVAQQKDGRLLPLAGDPFCGPRIASDTPVQAVRWRPPVEPRAILCIGLNYRKHAQEGGAAVPQYPVLFMKNPAAAIGHKEPIHIPKVCENEVDYEAELAVVIAKPCRDVAKENAAQYILGYTAANDVSARIWQSKLGGGQWNRGKGFDTFAPLGPVLVTPDEIPDPNSLAIRCELNGREVQRSNTSDMIFDVPALISFLSQDTTLLPGTVILTGTPEGVGWFREPRLLLTPGDTVTVEIEKVGTLTNPVRACL